MPKFLLVFYCCFIERIAGFARFRSGSSEAASRGEISQMRRCEPFKATSAHVIRRSDVAPNGATSVGRFAMGGIFSTNVDAEHKTFGYHKALCGERNPAYCKCAVACWRSVCCQGVS